MKGIAKRTIYVSNWSIGEPKVREIHRAGGGRKEITETLLAGTQLLEGEEYTIPVGRPDLERHFHSITGRPKPVAKPKISKPRTTKPRTKKG